MKRSLIVLPLLIVVGCGDSAGDRLDQAVEACKDVYVAKAPYTFSAIDVKADSVKFTNVGSDLTPDCLLDELDTPTSIKTRIKAATKRDGTQYAYDDGLSYVWLVNDETGAFELTVSSD